MNNDKIVSFKIDEEAEISVLQSHIGAISKAQDKVYLWMKGDPDPIVIGENYHTALKVWVGEI